MKQPISISLSIRLSLLNFKCVEVHKLLLVASGGNRMRLGGSAVASIHLRLLHHSRPVRLSRVQALKDIWNLDIWDISHGVGGDSRFKC